MNDTIIALAVLTILTVLLILPVAVTAKETRGRPIHPNRQMRRLGALYRAALMSVVLLAVLACGQREEPEEIPEPTPPPAEETTMHQQEPVVVFAAPETWTRYDVPLDDELQQYIYGLCGEYGMDMPLVLAVIQTESNFQADKIGDSGNSYGLMQIYASEHTERCIRLGAWNLFDPKMNVRAGIDFLAELIGWGYGVDYALSWYNGHGGALPWGYVDLVHARAAQIAMTAERR